MTKTNWGGPWTEEKLTAFAKYVNAYLTIMNKYRGSYHWELIYFDGFAGSGSTNNQEEAQEQLTLPNFELEELLEKNVYKGSAERVLSIEQAGFDKYYFVDLDKKAQDALKEKLSKFSDKNISYILGDANENIIKLSQALKQTYKKKALILLDPFGMQVNWDAIAELKGTGTDLWILVPVGVAVARLLDRNGDLTHINALTSFFGLSEEEIRDKFYETEIELTLFGEVDTTRKRDQSIDKISELYRERLGTIFKYVTDKPLVLRNSHNNPLYHFIFASNNQTAVKIASSIIGRNNKKR